MFKLFKEKLSKFFKSSEKPEKKPRKTPEEKQKQEELKQVKKLQREIKKQEKTQELKQKRHEKKKLEKQEEQIEKESQELEKENKQKIEYLTEQIEQEIEETESSSKLSQPKELGFFSRFKTKLTTVHINQETFNEFFEKLENLLLENNVALTIIDKIREDMEKKLINMEIKKSEIEQEVKNSLKESIGSILIEPFDLIEKIKQSEKPFVILFFGINGSGKTTTIAKIAKLLQDNKITSVFAAADTFRAASIEQLAKHGENLGIRVISQIYGADPAAVAFDAIKHAKAHAIDVVLIDTAGRMHTKTDLLREMEKIIRVTNPNLKIFVAESITGNDATEQAKKFNECFGIDASILTKADVDEKGGTAVSIGYVTKKPILFLGTGQKYEKLQKFSSKEILAGLGLE